MQGRMQRWMQGWMQRCTQGCHRDVAGLLQGWALDYVQGRAQAISGQAQHGQTPPSPGRGRDQAATAAGTAGTRRGQRDRTGSSAPCSLTAVPLADEALWCRTTRALREDEPLSAFVVAEPPAVPNHGVKAEPGESPYPAALHSDIQLLPQQAGMAAILATAVVNSESRGHRGGTRGEGHTEGHTGRDTQHHSPARAPQAVPQAMSLSLLSTEDVFPCKDCGIWYRSERNLQAHLMYYCASRQSAGAGSPALDEKPKETYPNERVCPFPQCKKSCPSASSLEIHMRSHSGMARHGMAWHSMAPLLWWLWGGSMVTVVTS